MGDLNAAVFHADISSFLPSLNYNLNKPRYFIYLKPHTFHQQYEDPARHRCCCCCCCACGDPPTPGHHSHHGHRDKHPEEHVCTEVDIQEIFEDGELIDIIEKIIPVACPEHGRHRPSHHNHHYHQDEDSSEEDSDEDK